MWILGVKGLKILNKQGQSQAKGHSQLWDRADLDTSERLPRPEINARVGYIKKSSSILPSVSFDLSYFTENLFLSILLLILLCSFFLSYILLKTAQIAYLVICKSLSNG